MKIIDKRIFYTLLLAGVGLIVTPNVQAQEDYDVDVEVSYGLNHLPALKANIERNTSNLLHAVNEASANKKGVNYTGIDITSDARISFNELWSDQSLKYASFDEDFNTPISEKVTLNQYGDYEMRNIPVIFLDENNPTDSHYEEIGINFNNNGTITDIFVTIERNQFQKILKDMSEIKDENNRLTILYWMESMATAYNKKNINWFEQFLSPDVLVVTGARRYTPNGETFEYRNYDKEGYISKLKKTFSVNPTIEVKFNDITITGHAMDTEGRYYAVECIQSWNATHYSDQGRLFVIWDFGRKDQPQILFRGWTEMDDPTRFTIYDINPTLE